MSWALALRLARRDVRRRPGRSALVVLLIAVPVCGMALAAVLFRTDQLDDAEAFRQTYGDVDAVALARTIDLPAGSETHRVRSVHAVLGHGDELVNRPVETRDTPLEGRFRDDLRLVEGQAPAAPGEVALSDDVLAAIGAGLGDTVRYIPQATFDSSDPTGSGRDMTVVGLVEDTDCLDCHAARIHPEEDVTTSQAQDLVMLPDDLADDELARLERAGEIFLRPGLGPDAGERRQGGGADADVRWALVLGAVALTVVGVVISSAFAVSARRHLATLGQLSAAGAPPRLLRRTLTLQGTVTGALGVLVGGALAAAVLRLGRGSIEEAMARRLPAWEVHPGELLAVAGLGIAAATVAALVPARTAARIPTLAALAGRRPLPPVPRRLTIGGLVSVGVGVALAGLAVHGGQAAGANRADVWLLVGIAGGVLQLLGMCAVTPLLAGGLEAPARRLRGPLRLGARSLARHRTRTGAVLAAVAAPAALALFAGGMVRSVDARESAASAERYELPGDVAVAQGRTALGTGDTVHLDRSTRDELAGAIPGAGQIEVRRAVTAPDHGDRDGASWRITSRSTPAPQVPPTPERASGEAIPGMGVPVLGDAAVLEALDVPGSVREQLDRHGMLWVQSFVDGGGSRPEVVGIETPGGTRLDVPTVPPDSFPERLGGLLISPSRVGELELSPEPLATVLHAPRPLTGEEREDLDAIEDRLMLESGIPVLWAGGDDSGVPPLQIEALLAGAALVMTLLVVGTSLALAAAESRDEREVLTVVGARPRDLARSAGARAGLLAAGGSLLGVPLGLASLAVVSWSVPDEVLLRPPWSTMGLLVVAVPAIAVLVATAASAVAQRARPVRVSTATFE